MALIQYDCCSYKKVHCLKTDTVLTEGSTKEGQGHLKPEG